MTLHMLYQMFAFPCKKMSSSAVRSCYVTFLARCYVRFTNFYSVTSVDVSLITGRWQCLTLRVDK